MNLLQAVIVITHATVIDASAPAPRRDQTVVVRGNKIVAVGASASVARPKDARIVDATGRFVIPGLWDMHVHTDAPGGRNMLPAYVVNGVTGVRDMASTWDSIIGWRRAIAAGTVVGPRLVASGPYLDGSDHPIAHILVTNVEQARAGVDSLKKLGVDVVKFHTGLTRETFFAAARRARELNIPFAGHVPRVITAVEASDSGMRSIEHLLTIPTPCTPAESIALLPRYTIQRVLGPCSSASYDAMWATFVRNNTWITPTYVAQYEVAHWPRRDLPGDVYAKYLPKDLRQFVLDIFPMPDSVPPDADVQGMAMYEKRVSLAGKMNRAGVHLLAGTDVPLRNSPPGFGLPGELVEFARGGVPLYDLLRIATYEPARYLAATDSMGTIQPGRVADIVILDADPLKDGRAYRGVWAVIANGRLYDAAARGQILAKLSAAAR